MTAETERAIFWQTIAISIAGVLVQVAVTIAIGLWFRR